MAENCRTLKGKPDAVWAVLADAQSYGDWVVGAKEIRTTSGHWPEVGAALHHTLGVGPVEVVKDKTVVVESDAGKHLRLRAQMRPLGEAEITFDLIPRGSSTEVLMEERFVGGLIGRLYGKLMSASIKSRNVETLRRLARRVEGGRPEN